MVPIGNEAPLALLTLGSARVEVIGISTELKRATFGLRDVPPTIATWHQFCPQVMHIRRRWVLWLHNWCAPPSRRRCWQDTGMINATRGGPPSVLTCEWTLTLSVAAAAIGEHRTVASISKG